MDKIIIKDLEVFGNHGVFKEENVLGQKFLVSAVLYTDTRKAGLIDDLDESINYGSVSAFIYDYIKSHTFQLLETVVESLARELLLYSDGLEEIELEIKKPWAPIGLPVDTVSVSIKRSWHTAYIALGSNIGDKEGYLKQAIKELKAHPDCIVSKVSSFHVTEPYGYTNQDEFLNACLELRTLLPAEELLTLLHKIEANANRERKIHWGPRTLDLDILLYDDITYETDDLCIPHVDMHRRFFVLEPLFEIAPYKRHPVSKKTIKELLDALNE